MLGLDPRPGLAAKARAELEGAGAEGGDAEDAEEAAEEAEERRRFQEGYCVLVDGVGESRHTFYASFFRLISDITSGAHHSCP